MEALLIIVKFLLSTGIILSLALWCYCKFVLLKNIIKTVGDDRISEIKKTRSNIFDMVLKKDYTDMEIRKVVLEDSHVLALFQILCSKIYSFSLFCALCLSTVNYLWG